MTSLGWGKCLLRVSILRIDLFKNLSPEIGNAQDNCQIEKKLKPIRIRFIVHLGTMTEKEQADLKQLTKHYKGDYQADTERSLTRLRAAMVVEEEAAAARRFTVGRKPKQLVASWRGVAATLALLLAGAGLFWFSQSTPRLYTATDEALALRLADGTLITLKPGSELAVLPDFGKGSRQVALLGEAFFDVAKDPKSPFSICQGPLCTRVLGTSFNLLCDPTASLMEVEVATGRVVLATPSDSVVVTARQYARFSAVAGWEEGEAANLNRQAWRTQNLYFDTEQLSVVLGLVGRAYGEEIITAPSLLKACDFPLTATFEGLPLEELLSDLSRLSGGRFEKNEQNGAYELLDWCE